jgi:hypothetical protein
MNYKDLDLCNYHSGPCSYKSWEQPLLAVGWIETAAFTKGSCPKDLIEKLKLLRKQTREIYFQFAFRGLHRCTLCLENSCLDNSEVNIFIPSNGRIYICPGRIDHYIVKHNYLPPGEFLEALKECPEIDSTEYKNKLYKANKEIEPPLYE